jgi:hypothetical protein
MNKFNEQFEKDCFKGICPILVFASFPVNRLILLYKGCFLATNLFPQRTADHHHHFDIIKKDRVNIRNISIIIAGEFLKLIVLALVQTILNDSNSSNLLFTSITTI